MPSPVIIAIALPQLLCTIIIYTYYPLLPHQSKIMKLTLTALTAVIGLSSAAAKDITTHSRVGQKLMSTARRVDDSSPISRVLENDDAVIDFSWVAKYSLKFQGCHNIPKWNDDADDENDVRVSNTALVRFRLCPSNSCTSDAYGCKSGYGDYVVGLDTYLAAYFESVQQDQEYNCEYAATYQSKCVDNGDDGYNEDYCLYDFYMGKNMEYCVDRNPYNDDNGEEEEEKQQDMKEMAECRQFEMQQDDNNNNNNNNNNGEEVGYYLGPFCSDDGSSIRMGLFTDDACTIFPDSSYGASTYASLTYGSYLAYADTSMIGSECMSCKEPQDADQNNQNDQNDADQVKEGCEQLYESAAKCEAGLSTGYAYFSPDNSACNYMQGIKIIRKNGNVYTVGSVKNKTATVFIALLGCAFAFLAGYSYYLKTKLDRAKINLSE